MSTLLQWGHGGDAVETRLPEGSTLHPERFNGATAVTPWKRASTFERRWNVAWLQWGHGGDAVETGVASGRRRPGSPGFNGATAVTPWKPLVAVTLAGGKAVTQRNRFNGATAVTPWKLHCAPRSGRHSPVLQWGHGGDAVETLRVARAREG